MGRPWVPILVFVVLLIIIIIIVFTFVVGTVLVVLLQVFISLVPFTFGFRRRSFNHRLRRGGFLRCALKLGLESVRPRVRSIICLVALRLVALIIGGLRLWRLRCGHIISLGRVLGGRRLGFRCRGRLDVLL